MELLCARTRLYYCIINQTIFSDKCTKRNELCEKTYQFKKQPFESALLWHAFRTKTFELNYLPVFN